MIFCPHTSSPKAPTVGENVLECSLIKYKLRFSALASCVALPPASMRRVRIFASAYVQDVLYADFAGAKIGDNKISIRAKHS